MKRHYFWAITWTVGAALHLRYALNTDYWEYFVIAFVWLLLASVEGAKIRGHFKEEDVRKERLKDLYKD
jgi:hypothetical protein